MVIEMHAFASAYAGNIYVVWNQEDFFDKYELYRNGVLVGETTEEDFGPFERPMVFDRDHHTNLFRKDSVHQLMFVDDTVKPYTNYTYQVKGYHGDSLCESDIAYITLQ